MLGAMKHLLLTLIGAVVVCGLAACNTISGIGEDVSGLGSDISAGAEAVADNM
jgi:predicted small secreted protein